MIGSTCAAASLIMREIVGDPGDEVTGPRPLDFLRFERERRLDDLGAQLRDCGHRDPGEGPRTDPCAHGHDHTGDRDGDRTLPHHLGPGTARQLVDEATDRPRTDEPRRGIRGPGDDEEDDPPAAGAQQWNQAGERLPPGRDRQGRRGAHRVTALR